MGAALRDGVKIALYAKTFEKRCKFKVCQKWKGSGSAFDLALAADRGFERINQLNIDKLHEGVVCGVLGAQSVAVIL
jgi:hypothetical protein